MPNDPMDLRFHLKHWLLTLLIGGLVTSAVVWARGSWWARGTDALMSLPFLYPVSLFLSLPSAVLYFITGYVLNRGQVNVVLKKIVLVAFSIICILATFKSLTSSFQPATSLIYGLASVVSALLVRYPASGEASLAHSEKRT